LIALVDVMKHTLMLALVSMLPASTALAGGPPGNGMFGFNSTRVAGKVCKIDSTLDKGAYIQSVPALKEIGLLNPDYVTQTRVNVEPTVLAMGYLLQVAPLTTKAAFDDDPNATICTFAFYILE
jgi:hypothetical protein